ncbi:MAG: Topoisomerase 1-associated factor 1, partial [Pleopsidium flavum]
MSESPLAEDQEIAENIQNRIFYEETTHDRIIAILRGYKDQGFGYLNASTELSHVFLRMLERYSKENIDLQVRSRRRARRKRKAAKDIEKAGSADSDDGSEAEDMAEAHRLSKERKFDFTRFSLKFMTQSCIDTFLAFTRYYNELDVEQLKRAHRFFYRVAFKQEMSVMLFRVDIIALFNTMMKGPGGLDSSCPVYKEWDELVRQLIKRLTRKIEQRPELVVEMLFSKINATVHYLEYGFEKQTIKSKPRGPAELEVKGGKSKGDQIGVVVAALSVEGKLDAVGWVKSVLAAAASERQAWEAAAVATSSEHTSDDSKRETSTAPSIIVKPDGEARRIAIFKDNKLRLLMTLVGFERLGIDDEPSTSWIIPSSLSSKELAESAEVVERHKVSPELEYGDEDNPVAPQDLLRRKALVRPRAAYDDDSGDDDAASNGEEDFLFPAGGPTVRKSDALEDLKRRRRKVKENDAETSLDEETREARRRAREDANLEKRRKIKSDLFVHDSDEDDDEERDLDFFAQEEERRKGQSMRVLE